MTVVKITGADTETMEAVFGQPAPPDFGSTIRSSDGVEIECRTMAGRGVVEGAQVVTFALSNLMAVGTGLAANWLYAKLKAKKSVTLTVNGKPVRVTRSDLEAALAGSLEQFKDDDPAAK